MLLICIRYDCLNSSALEEHNVRFNFLDTIEVGKELCIAKFICSIFDPLFIYCVYRTVKCRLILPDASSFAVLISTIAKRNILTAS